ncbi:MAG: SBBP repeat-containing protein [Nitrospiraceae bacterium]|nr:SBBP repeat-containing protein [Nitrospiraceae bacterium]
MLEKNGVEFPLPGGLAVKTARLYFAGKASSSVIDVPSGEKPLPGVSNYLLGNKPSKWIAGVPQFAEVRYKNIWPATDVVFRPVKEGMEFDVVLKKGADPENVSLCLANASFKPGPGGSLVIGNAPGLVLEKPVIYEENAGNKKVRIAGGFELKDASHAGFKIARFDVAAEKTVIDPVLVFSTYIGGSQTDQAQAAAADSSGNFYIAGFTMSSNFPVLNPEQSLWKGGTNFGDAFVAKFNPSGTLVYSTFLGGSADDAAYGLAVDGTGAAYVTGLTKSIDFPLSNPLQSKLTGSQNVFVAKLSPDGRSFAYSTYVGGSASDQGAAIFVNSSGAAYVTGTTTSTNFPVMNAQQPKLQGASNAFYFRLAPAGNSLQYSTFLGGSASDKGAGIAVDAAGNAFVTGTATSSNFPITPGARQTTLAGGSNAFLAKFSPAGQLVFSTYHGGTAIDSGNAVALDSSGNAYVTGSTTSSNFPVLGAFQPFGGGNDAFVSKFSPTGGLVYSTFLGGSADDFGQAITVSPANEAIIAGRTISTDFPLKNPIQSSLAGENAFVTKLNSLGSGTIFSTLLGGNGDDQALAVALDPPQNIFAAGRTSSTDFPVQNAAQPGFAGSFDAFATEISASLNAPPSIPLLNSPANGATGLGTSVTFTWQRASEPEGEGIEYNLFVCTDPGFANCLPTQTAFAEKPKGGYAARLAGMISLVAMGLVLFRKGKSGLASVILAFAVFTSASSCGGHKSSTPAGTVQLTISGLNHNTVYYWKVIAIDSAGASSQSETRSFTTG